MNTAGRARVIGVIGGSGLYDIEGFEDARWVVVDSPFGRPSDEFHVGHIGGQRVAFLPRHGRGHKIPPSEINFRANVDAMKRLGVTDLLSVSAVGSLREELPPGTFVLVDQFIDRTFARAKSFFGTGLVAHVSMADPVCHKMGALVAEAATRADVGLVQGGTYLAMEGPQFSSLAESELYRSWMCHVIGMTNMPEAKLAREAELCYASVAMVTDYDCWHEGHADVTVSQVIKVLHDNAAKARALVKAAVPLLGTRPRPCAQGCENVLEHAVITAPEARDPAMLARLSAVAGRVLQ